MSYNFNEELIKAVAKNNQESTRSILEASKKGLTIDINHRDSRGMTALHYATLNNNETLVKNLIDLGANVNIDLNNQQTIPTPRAITKTNKKKYANVRKILKDHDAKPSRIKGKASFHTFLCGTLAALIHPIFIIPTIIATPIISYTNQKLIQRRKAKRANNAKDSWNKIGNTNLDKLKSKIKKQINQDTSKDIPPLYTPSDNIVRKTPENKELDANTSQATKTNKKTYSQSFMEKLKAESKNLAQKISTAKPKQSFAQSHAIRTKSTNGIYI